LDEVHVIVGTLASARALVTRLVLMYTTCRESGVREASSRYDAYRSDSAASASEQPIASGDMRYTCAVCTVV